MPIILKLLILLLMRLNSGSPFYQWKKGIELAKGKYVWIAESDDWADVKFLETMVPILANSPRIGMAYSESYITDENSTVINVWSKKYIRSEKWKHDFISNGKKACRDFLSCYNTIPNASAVIFNRKIFRESIIDFPKDFKFAGDWYIWVQLLQHNDLAYIAKPLNYFRDSLQSTRVKSSKEEKSQLMYETIKVPILLKSLNSLDIPAYNKCMRAHILWGTFQIFQGRADQQRIHKNIEIFSFPIYTTFV